MWAEPGRKGFERTRARLRRIGEEWSGVRAPARGNDGKGGGEHDPGRGCGRPAWWYVLGLTVRGQAALRAKSFHPVEMPRGVVYCIDYLN